MMLLKIDDFVKFIKFIAKCYNVKNDYKDFDFNSTQVIRSFYSP